MDIIMSYFTFWNTGPLSTVLEDSIGISEFWFETWTNYESNE